MLIKLTEAIGTPSLISKSNISRWKFPQLNSSGSSVVKESRVEDARRRQGNEDPRNNSAELRRGYGYAGATPSTPAPSSHPLKSRLYHFVNKSVAVHNIIPAIDIQVSIQLGELMQFLSPLPSLSLSLCFCCLFFSGN